MSTFEMPETWQAGDELQGLTVESYPDRNSVYWHSQTNYRETARLFSELVSSDSDALLEAQNGGGKGSFEYILSKDPVRPEFLVVYGSNYSLSWEVTDSSSFEIGVASREPVPDVVAELFRRSTGTELDPESQDEISELLTGNVDSKV